ncbi:MAG: transporter substrate-binding domain-containing protein [Sulfurimonas sp.]|jgi:polar amino acid transport system substrate-binding protein
MTQFIIIFLLTISCLEAAYKELSINSGFPFPETNLVESIVTEGFKRANIPMKYQTLPTERSLINANIGIDDGEAGRIWDIDKLYPNLVRIPVSIHSIDIVILSRKNLHIKTPSDLKLYNVGLIRGVKIAESIAQKAEPLSIVEATDYLTLIKMLTNHRIDVIITSKIALLTMLGETKEQGLYMTAKPLASLPLYSYLNKKHQALVPQLEKAYKSMVDDGTIEKVHNAFLHNLEIKISATVNITDD